MNPEYQNVPQQGQGPVMPPNTNMPPVSNQPMPNQPQGGQYPNMNVSASELKKQKPWVLIIALILFILAFLGSSGFAFWAYAEMQDYKNNSDQKVGAAVESAVAEANETKEKEFLERSKNPYKKYKGPATYGAVEITYPRTWAAFVDEKGGSTGVDGYFHPDFVPGPKSDTAFALRLEVLERPYDSVLGSFDSNAKRGLVRVTPFKAERVPSVLGARIDGEVVREKQGSVVLLPLRDKTIKISTLSSESFGKDFNEVVLKNLMFTP